MVINGRTNDDGELAASLKISSGELAGGASEKLLVHLRQFTRDNYRSFTKQRPCLAQHFANPMRRFEKRECMRRLSDRSQPLFSGVTPIRSESPNREWRQRKAGRNQSRQRGARARDRIDLDSIIDRCLDELDARV